MIGFYLTLPYLVIQSRVIQSKVITLVARASQLKLLVCFAAIGAWQRNKPMKRIPALILRSSFSHGVPLTIRSQFVASIRGCRFYDRVLGIGTTFPLLILLFCVNERKTELAAYLLLRVHRYIYPGCTVIASWFRLRQKNHADPVDSRIAINVALR